MAMTAEERKARKRQRARVYYASNRDRIIARGSSEAVLQRKRERYAANPEPIKAKQRAYRKATKDKQRTYAGLPPPRYPMTDHCECCGSTDLVLGRVLNLDHVHGTDWHRGWLCACNAAIGALGDDLDGVLNAVEYLIRHDFRVWQDPRKYAARLRRITDELAAMERSAA